MFVHDAIHAKFPILEKCSTSLLFHIFSPKFSLEKFSHKDIFRIRLLSGYALYGTEDKNTNIQFSKDYKIKTRFHIGGLMYIQNKIENRKKMVVTCVTCDTS